ncbi:MAG: SMC family ATPase [Nitrososphaera sp.]
MIKDIEMKDFIAHHDTRLQFCRGITVFVGHNGSGKSSVIDAITFALFGKHTRKLGRNLVRRGANGAMVKLHFTINSREFSVVRNISATGTLAHSQFELVSDSGKAVSKKIAGGERRSLGGESMSDEVAKVLGLDYEKLRIAAVVQQGELGKIVEATPKDFKLLLNSLIGIDRLDAAYLTMADVLRGFEDRVRDENSGYGPQDMPKVEDAIAQARSSMEQSEKELAELERQRREVSEKVASIDLEIERLGPLAAKVSELQRTEKVLLQQVNSVMDSLSSEVSRLDRLVITARVSAEALKSKPEVTMQLRMVSAELDDVQCRLVENEGQLGKLRGYSEYAGKLVITDGKCPVCDSPVQKLNKVFDGVHVAEETRRKNDEKSKLTAERNKLNAEKKQLEARSSEIAAAEKFLDSNSIILDAQGGPGNPDNPRTGQGMTVTMLEKQLEDKKSLAAKLPGRISRVDDPARLVVDEVTRTLAATVQSLRDQTQGFDQQRFSNARLERDSLSRRLQRISEDTGRYQKTRDDSKAAVENGEKIKRQLQSASEFAKLLEKIRTTVYNRDGPIGISLRSWALKMISAKASEYAALFNIGISRIELSEKAREVEITCYGRHGEIDTDSMSGGEKVAIALALRLGIAYMMGSNKLDFIILDEPTTHLDEERRKALVRIISEAFREGAGPLAQLIIITHDTEIFEDSEVDQIFRFSMTSEGSQV